MLRVVLIKLTLALLGLTLPHALLTLSVIRLDILKTFPCQTYTRSDNSNFGILRTLDRPVRHTLIGGSKFSSILYTCLKSIPFLLDLFIVFFKAPLITLCFSLPHTLLTALMCGLDFIDAFNKHII